MRRWRGIASASSTDAANRRWRVSCAINTGEAMAPGDEASTLEILPAAGLRAARPRAPRFPPLYQLIRNACAPLLRARFDLEVSRSEEHTSELQSHHDLVCRL